MNNNINYYYEKLSEFDYSIIRNSFSVAENSFIKGKYDLKFSGSTGICIFINENKVICANWGNSLAILVTIDKFNVNKNFI
jgi:serine/threonine protein phosphatase PrpC